jgi:two-component sensor histidine kinase
MMGRFRTAVDRLIEQPHQPSGSIAAYGLAVACVAIAFLFRLQLGLLDHDASPFTMLYPAVLFAALWGGVRAGLLAVVLGGTLSWWAFFDPRFTFVPPLTFAKQLSLIIYVWASLMIVVGADYCRRLAKSLKDEEEFRNLVVKELGHRLKNKVATIQSIVAYQLRGHATTRSSILQRLSALSSADMLIEASQGQGAFIKDIIRTELGPYDISRAIIQGPQLFLPPKLALVLALVLHELATNAAKYGALSVPTGHISVSLSIAETKLFLQWKESGGPAVTIPTHKGFGSKLFSRALGQFDGIIETNFASVGLVCTMSLSLSSEVTIECPAAPVQGKIASFVAA